MPASVGQLGEAPGAAVVVQIATGVAAPLNGAASAGHGGTKYTSGNSGAQAASRKFVLVGEQPEKVC